MKTPLTTTLIVPFIIIISSSVFAQNPDKVLARVRYSFSHIQDTLQKDKPYTENMLLVIGKNASIYTSYDKINQALNRQKQIEEQVKNQAGSTNISFKFDSKDNPPISALDYFYFAQENKFFTKERVFNDYLIEEQITKIGWKITKDTTSFSGVHCQKATTYFKGRNWIAWYATELPFQSGPWKLNGLPGLIIEAYDDKNEVQFKFAGIQNVTNLTEKEKVTLPRKSKILPSNGMGDLINIGNSDSTIPYLGDEIRLPENAIKATRNELNNLKEARVKDPQGFIKTQFAGSISNMVITGASAQTTPTAPKIMVNNPIELPEKNN